MFLPDNNELTSVPSEGGSREYNSRQGKPFLSLFPGHIVHVPTQGQGVALVRRGGRALQERLKFKCLCASCM
jgi:hypothetical protein